MKIKIFVGITHSFKIGLGPVELGKTPSGNFNIVSDRDICYDGRVIIRRGSGIPFYDLHNKSGNFTPILDFRNAGHRGHNFRQELLTGEFEIWVENSI